MYPLMENHDFAFRMQKEFIKDIEAMNPKYLIYIGVPTSWLRLRDSHEEIFLWLDAYLQKGLKLVGAVEILKDKAVYHWEPDVKFPVGSRFWIAIFERKA